MASKAYSIVQTFPSGTTGTGLDQIVVQIGRDLGLAGANLGTNITGGMTAANGLNQLIVAAKQATGVANNGIFIVNDVIAINTWIRANRLADFTALHGDDNGTTETGFHLVQNNGATQRYRDQNLVDTVFDGLYHIGFPIQNGVFLNEDGSPNATVAQVADWLTQFYTDRATTNTGLDRITELIIADKGLGMNIPWQDIAGGADAANGLNNLYKTAIATYNLAADGWISESDIQQINTWIRSNTTRYNNFVALHGDDENNIETGFHLVQNDGAHTVYFAQNLVNTVADGLYHIGFEIQNGQFLNEDGDPNAMVKDVADWATYFYIDQSTTGTGLDKIVDTIKLDTGLATWTNAGDINGGAAAANQLNLLLINGITATGIAADGWITNDDIRTLNQWVRADATRYNNFLVLHGDDENGTETGYHLVQNDGATTQYFGKNLVNTVADGIYHIGFTIEENYLVNEDGDPNAYLNDIASWLNYFYLQKTLIYGSNAKDTINGTNLAEHLMGYSGADTLNGGGGDDLLDGDWGSDVLKGGAGNDVLYGGADNDKLDGGDGSDSYYVSGNLADGWWSFQGYDTYTDTGATGTDQIIARGAGNVDLGLLAFSATNGIEKIDGTGVSGTLKLVGDWRANTLNFSAVTFVGTNIRIHGDWGNDNITGTAGNNVIIGGGDNDTLNGGNGADDYLYSGYMSDDWSTFDGFDTIADKGTAGSDRLLAISTGKVDIGLLTFGPSSGIEIVDGTGAGGIVTLLGNSNGNILNFSTTTFVGTNIRINGDWGNDTITGTAGNNVIIGGGDNDILDGRNGADDYLYSGYMSEDWGTFEGFDTLNDTGTIGSDRLLAISTGKVDIGLLTFGPSSGIEIVDGTGAGGIVTLLGNSHGNILNFSSTTFVGTNIRINGDWGNDTITGTAGNNVIIGGGDNDILDGRNGADDYLYFGYTSDDWGTFEGFDTLNDTGTTGSDRLLAISTGKVDIGLLIFGPSSGIEIIDGTGAGGLVTLLGDSNGNVLNFSTTTFVGTNIRINGEWGNDTITGTSGNNVIIGGGDNDILDGRNGADDYLYSGYDSDDWGTFEGFDILNDTGTTGSDRLVAMSAGKVDIGLVTFGPSSGIEIVDGTGAGGIVTLLGDWNGNTLNFSTTTFVGTNIRINGDWGNDIITGTSGNNVIIGGGDNDILDGRNGSDDYLYSGYVSEDWDTSEGFDILNDTGTTGSDRLLAISTGNVDIGLSFFDSSSGIEIVDGTGAGGIVTLLGDWNGNTLDFSTTTFVGTNIRINGEGGCDTLIGTSSNDTLIGGGADDTLDGRNGSDNYLYSGITGGDWSLDEGYDTITDTGNTGTDRILAQSTGNVDICLIAFDVSNGIEIIDGTGAAGTLRLLGQWDANLLDFSSVQLIGGNIEIHGEDGDDTLIGSSGNDRIFGDVGEDTLIGGLGTDQLTGGNDGDYFVFNSSAEIGKGTNRDRILDFQATANVMDVIDLSAIDANTLVANDQSFTFIGSTAFVNASNAAGQLRFAGGVLSGDTNGDAVSDFELAIAGVTTLSVDSLVL